MPTDPASIPEHVVEVLHKALCGCALPAGSDRSYRTVAAAMLDALMDDKHVPALDEGAYAPKNHEAWVKPSDVLAAVLAGQGDVRHV